MKFSCLLLFCCIISTIVAEGIDNGIVEFKKKNLGHLLSSKGDKNVLIVFETRACENCESKFYDIVMAQNSFIDYKDFVVGSVKAEKYPSLIKKYDIDVDSETPEIRLIYKDTKKYASFNGNDLTAWLTKELGYTAKTSYVNQLTPETYATLTKEKKDILLEFYTPTCIHCQKLALTIDKLAYTWTNEPKVSIAKINCLQYDRFCDNYKITQYPTFKFFKGDNSKTPETVDNPTVDTLMTFLNNEYKSKRIFGGGFDDEFGTSAKLSRLSKDLVDEPIRAEKMKILAEIKKSTLKKAAIYINYLEQAIKEGNDYLADEYKKVKNEIKSIDVLSEKYPEVKRRLNILKSIQPTNFNKLIELNTLNFDHFINGHRNVLVMFIKQNHEKCQNFLKAFEQAVPRHPDNVIFTYIYGDKYPSIANRYQLHTTPAIKWFAMNGDLKNPEEVGLQPTAESILDFVDEQLDAQRDDEL
ncbi:hypothetical protein WA158_005629 [Blastocystis sp. Blastoise]